MSGSIYHILEWDENPKQTNKQTNKHELTNNEIDIHLKRNKIQCNTK